jgi:hypothetical protein
MIADDFHFDAGEATGLRRRARRLIW